MRDGDGKWVAFQLLLFGIAYPCLAGLDSARQTLYLNLCCVVFLSCVTRLLVKRLHDSPSKESDALAIGLTA